MNELIEVKNWGFNQIVISSFFTMLFTFFQAYGLIKQNQKIWRHQSGESVSVLLFFSTGAYFLAFIFYALDKNSLAMIFNSLLAIMYIPIMIGLIKFKKFRLFESILCPLSFLFIPAMIITEEKDNLLFAFLMLSLVMIFSQVLEMISQGKTGSAEPKFIIIFCLTCFFWSVYAFSINNLVLEIFNTVAVLLYGSMLVLYYKFHRRELKQIKLENLESLRPRY